MTKNELISKVAKDAQITKAAAEKAVASITQNITKTLAKGDRVYLRGFGTFAVVRRKARTGRNPRTGQTIHIPAHKAVSFRPHGPRPRPPEP